MVKFVLFLAFLGGVFTSGSTRHTNKASFVIIDKYLNFQNAKKACKEMNMRLFEPKDLHDMHTVKAVHAIYSAPYTFNSKLWTAKCFRTFRKRKNSCLVHYVGAWGRIERFRASSAIHHRYSRPLCFDPQAKHPFPNFAKLNGLAKMFRYDATPRTFASAKSYCASKGMNIVEPRSLKLFVVLKKVLAFKVWKEKLAFPGQFWVGVTGSANQGTLRFEFDGREFGPSDSVMWDEYEPKDVEGQGCAKTGVFQRIKSTSCDDKVATFCMDTAHLLSHNYISKTLFMTTGRNYRRTLYSSSPTKRTDRRIRLIALNGGGENIELNSETNEKPKLDGWVVAAAIGWAVVVVLGVIFVCMKLKEKKRDAQNADSMYTNLNANG